MKTVLLLLLVFSTLLVGCAQQTPEVTQTRTTPTIEEPTETEALEEIDNSLLAEDDEIEIGEMI